MEVINATAYSTTKLTELFEACLEHAKKSGLIPDYFYQPPKKGRRSKAGTPPDDLTEMWNTMVIRVEYAKTQTHSVKALQSWHVQEDNVRLIVHLPPKHADPKTLVEKLEKPFKRLLHVTDLHWASKRDAVPLFTDKRPWMDVIMGGGTIPAEQVDPDAARELAEIDRNRATRTIKILDRQIKQYEKLLGQKQAERVKEVARLADAEARLQRATRSAA